MWGSRMRCHFCDTWRPSNAHVPLSQANVKRGHERQFDGVDLACTVEGCSFVSANFLTLCEHLNWHIKDGKKMSCPYTNCSRYFRVRSSFASHLNRKHKKISNVSTPCSSQTNTSATNITSTCMNLSSEHELGHTFETIFDDDNDNTNDEVDTDGFL